MKPVPHDGGPTGGPEKPIEKPMDKPAGQYAVRDTTPPEKYSRDEPLDEGLMENPGDLSKRFSS